MIWALAVLALLGVLIGAWELRPKPPVDPYRTAEVTRGDLTRSVSASGSMQALVTVQVGSQVSGQIQTVLVDFNSPVTRNQVLAVIDPTTYASRVQQAQADLGAQQAALNQQQAGLQQALAQVAVDKATYDRTVALTQKGYDSPSALETAEATFKRSQAGVGQATALVGAQRARIVQSQAALQASRLDLAHTRIVSPIDGVVVNRAVDPGQTVQASFQTPTLFQIAQDLSKLQVKILVDEADIGQVKEGLPVTFTVDAFPDQTFTGTVTQVRKQPETQSNVVAYEVIAEAANPKGQLLPGMTANADILIEQKHAVLRVPNAALRFKPVEPARPQGFGGASGGAGFGGRAFGGGQAFQQLNLTADQQQSAKQIFGAAAQQAFAGDADPAARKKIFDAANVQFEAILNPDQKAKFIAIIAQAAADRAGSKPGVVYVLRDGKPVSVPVRVGATDGTNTEVIGRLTENDQVIVGGGPRAKVQLRGPVPGLGGGGPNRPR
ncbi:MAG: efflux RND transporter periplasmic adaptor subunit [Caulobacterales bacterium]